MKIAIFGAGAIGAFVGVLLQSAGHAVLFIGRQRLLDEIDAGGAIVARDLDGKERRIPRDQLNYSVDPASLASFDPDVILVATKSDATISACEEIAKALAGSSRVVIVASLQNGVENPIKMRELLPSDRFEVYGGMVGFNIAIQPKGLYVQGTKGLLVLEDTGNTRGITASQLGEACKTAGMLVEVDPSPVFRATAYGKLCTNLGNAVNALSAGPVLDMIENRWFRRILAQLYRESLAVCHAYGIEPKSATGIPMNVTATIMDAPDAVFRVVARQTLKVNRHARSSMLVDVTEGRMTEVAHLNGMIVRLAEKASPPLPTPFNRACLRLIQEWEEGDRKTPPKYSGEELWNICAEEARKEGVRVGGLDLFTKFGLVLGTTAALGAGLAIWRARSR